MDIKDKVVINDDDVKMIEDFFNNYAGSNNDLVMTDRLKKELDKFKSKGQNYDPEDQHKLTIALCGALYKSTHPLIQDEAIKEVIAACGEVWNEGEFYEQLENAMFHSSSDPQSDLQSESQPQSKLQEED
jgi:hypothetical protein